jgi:hypothetical protein
MDVTVRKGRHEAEGDPQSWGTPADPPDAGPPGYGTPPPEGTPVPTADRPPSRFAADAAAEPPVPFPPVPFPPLSHRAAEPDDSTPSRGGGTATRVVLLAIAAGLLLLTLRPVQGLDEAAGRWLHVRWPMPAPGPVEDGRRYSVGTFPTYPGDQLFITATEENALVTCEVRNGTAWTPLPPLGRPATGRVTELVATGTSTVLRCQAFGDHRDISLWRDDGSRILAYRVTVFAGRALWFGALAAVLLVPWLVRRRRRRDA